MAGRLERATTSTAGTDFGHSWLDQMKSSPEISLTTTVDDETRKVQAAESIDEISSPTATGLPATGELRTGVTTTSSSEHGPSG